VWKEAPKSTTQSVGERGRSHGCEERARGGALGDGSWGRGPRSSGKQLQQ
jgi:hypothetical protein